MRVGCMGELLVEIMRDKVDVPLGVPGVFLGPYPSGAPAIFADCLARLKGEVFFVGAIGRDDFGFLVLERLQNDGVDTSGIKILDDFTTGVAFVTYFSDGSRKFIYHISRAASGQIFPEDIREEDFVKVDLLHVMGSTMLINENCRASYEKAIRIVRGAKKRVSFDPNFRPELLGKDRARELFLPILKESFIVFPTEEELSVLTGEQDPLKAAEKVLSEGPEIVAIKQGKRGSTVVTRKGVYTLPAFPVEEVDPTGAGDCYCAGFLAALSRGMSVEEAGRFANAVGALAVTRKGPMEGAPTWEDVEAFLERF
ncbi:carbohydrate kinase family protein [Candidatus Caldatribacterium sp. SIUC1]|uniref:carbohydrate kinase family protein n=1 Tax=Candidatus Caldatribacterium sp. SIUC1 TaxID=3418365 RepID=UPI003F693D5A